MVVLVVTKLYFAQTFFSVRCETSANLLHIHTYMHLACNTANTVSLSVSVYIIFYKGVSVFWVSPGKNSFHLSYM